MSKRNSNIELLRIISIILIVLSHYCVHGVGHVAIAQLDFGINRFLLELFSLGNLGSILFILISGYYLINSNSIKVEKLLRIIFQILFYSLSIYAILIICNIKSFEIKDFIKSFLPISFKVYWFATAYIVLYLFHPFINCLLKGFDRKKYLLFIGSMFVVFSLLHMVTTNDYYGNEIIQFLLFYSIGAYLQRYPNNYFNNKKNSINAIVLTSIIIIASIIFFDFLGQYKPIFGLHSTYLLSRTSPFLIILSIGIFSIFNIHKKKENVVINTIASLIFGVYLISDNYLLRDVIWHDVFNNISYIYSPYLILHIFFSVIVVVISCLLIDLIRKYLFEKSLFHLMDSKIGKIERDVHTYFTKKFNHLL